MSDHDTKPEPPFSGTRIPADPDKARAWNKQWREKHAPRHGGSFVSRYGRAHFRELNFDSPSCRVILELERQINDGRQLSVVAGKEGT